MLILGLILAFIIGVTLGLLGGGGAILTVPVLHYVIDLPVDIAIASSLVVVGLTSAFATINHARHGRVQWRVGLIFGAASMLTAYGVGKVGKHIPPTIRLLGFALVMAAAAFAMLRGAYKAMRAPAQAKPAANATPLAPASLNLQGLIPLGAVVGALTGAVGAGGGFLIVPALTLMAGVPMHHAVGTSLFVIALNSAAGFAGSGMWRSIPIETIAGVVALAIAGSLVGSRVSQRVSASALREGFGWFIVVMAAFIASMEAPRQLGLTLSATARGGIVATAVGLAVVAAVVTAQRLRRHRR